MFTEEHIHTLARRWCEHKNNQNSSDNEIEETLVLMNFTTGASLQWKFITLAIDLLENDDGLGALAAGPVEHLLGHHGDDYIQQVEVLAMHNSQFAKMLTGCWQYKMNDDVRSRLQLLIENAKTSGNSLD